MKNKILLTLGTIFLLLVSFSFSSYFALTALAKLYAQSLNTSEASSMPGAVLAQMEIDAFINQQLIFAFLVLIGSILALLAIVAWRAPRTLSQSAVNNIGWPLFLLNGLAQLLALGLYIRNFIVAVPFNPVINTVLPDVVIEISTTLVIASLLFVEFFIMLLKVWQTTNFTIHSLPSPVDPSSIRPVIFLFLLGVDLSAAFVPLHMKNLYQPLLDVPKDIVLGLPISAMFFSVSITIVLSGIWLDRRGWHEPFLAGLALTASAMIYAWLASSALHFILAMGLVGLGYGLSLMASQGFVIVHTDAKGKASGLAYLFAGMYAGSICGTAAGAMLAERIGYGPVFLLSGVLVFLTLAYTVVALRGAIRTVKPPSNIIIVQQSATVVTAKHYWNFLSNRYVLGLIFLSSLPSAIAVIGLLNYFGPVYLNRLGVSQSIIGSVLILYSLCMVYLGPFVSKYIDASDNKRLFVFIGCALGGCAFLSFHFLTGLMATITAVLLLGLSSCFVLASQTTYALTLHVTKQLGQGRSIGIFRASSRIGQMLGPILFGWLMATTNINQGLTYFGIAYLATAVLFILLTSERVLFRDKVICESSSASN
jgi:MFS family permease